MGKRMALSRSILHLIADENGKIAPAFLQLRPSEWASQHMQRRYGAVVPADDVDPRHPTKLCYDFLLEEYRILRSGFDKEGTISRLLMSRSLSTQRTAPIGNGIGWDFRPDGDPEPSMLQFKGTLMACRLAADLRTHDGGGELGGIAKLVRAGYQARADLHIWNAVDDVSGADIARRWIAFQTYNFLINCRVEEMLAWSTSRCREVFGTIS
jgi:hypothetical protein